MESEGFVVVTYVVCTIFVLIPEAWSGTKSIWKDKRREDTWVPKAFKIKEDVTKGWH